MECVLNHIAGFLDNSTVAGVITVLLGIIAASYVYRRQKNIDREYEAQSKLMEALLTLLEQCRSVNQIIDRLANTYIQIKEKNDKEAAIRFATESLPTELTQAVDILMYRLPDTIGKIGGIASIYFHASREVQSDLESIYAEFKRWHDFVQNHAQGKSGMKFDLEKRVSEVEQFSLFELDSRIKKLAKRFHQ